MFVFSMGLLTPIIGKKDIISVLAIGFVVGLVGGTFFYISNISRNAICCWISI
ncbi:hypothetical protein [Methanobrevibacter arboriphilus]|uniref:hypothetical protein n=1 Tax=Methanobrevibacter arboriphilus TaxID=39441 RepID=UPI001CDA871A|nr:hypothetical protein [Methanobrevibacter arboriphilus]